MTPEQVFLHRFAQLEQILASRQVAALLDLALILRQLLVDGTTLTASVNRNHRLKLRFTVGQSTQQSLEGMFARGIPLPMMMWQGDVMDGQWTQTLTLDEFLKHGMAHFNGEHYTVRQIIKACANRLGGVHLGDPAGDDEEAAALRRFNSSFIVGGAPSV